MKTLTYLTQTDTTVGLLSQSDKSLQNIKKRPNEKKFITSVNSFTTLKKFARIPKKFKKLVRNSKATTFIYPNNIALRVITNQKHLILLNKLKWCYTTSANQSGEKYDFEFAKQNVDVVIYDGEFQEKKASKIIKLGKRICKKLR